MPVLGTNEVDWDNISFSPSTYVTAFNDAGGKLGYSISGTAGIFLNVNGFIIIFSYHNKINVFFTISRYNAPKTAYKLL